MHRFKPSKFKNAAAKTPKREEIILDISARSLQSSYGNHIKASSAFMVFCVDSGTGGNLAVLPVNDVGRKDASMPLLFAHSSLMTDFDFSPFNPYLLATCAADGLIKLWELPEKGLTANLSTAQSTLPNQGGRVESVLFHPTADGLLAASVQKSLKLFDVHHEKEMAGMNVFGDTIQSLSWKLDGTLLAASSKDKKLRLLDARQGSVTAEANGHQNMKDSRVCWLGNKDYLVSSGFNQSRGRQLMVWDVRSFQKPIESHDFGQSTGIIIPLFDPDTNMMFLSGQGDTSVRYYEVKESSPWLKEAHVYISQMQTKGIALVPKHALDVMTCEVNRVLQLTQNSVVPLKYEVPRKSYRDFQTELFPDTRGFEAGVSLEDWFEGKNGTVSLVSLDPSKRTPVHQGDTSATTRAAEEPSIPEKQPEPNVAAEGKPAKPQKPELSQKSKELSVTSPAAAQSPASSGPSKAQAQPEKAVAAPKKFVRFTSKFRHINSTLAHRNTFITNLRATSISTTGGCDGFHANKKWAAVPLKSPGGNISILDMSQRIKLPETGVPYIQHGCGFTDFAWDPFDDDHIAVSTESVKIALWEIRGLDMSGELDAEILLELQGHSDKIYFIKFHPLAQDVLLSASQDLTVKIWDVKSEKEMITLEGHTGQIYSAAWSQDGRFVATYSKDAKIRIYDPRTSTMPIKEGSVSSAPRGGRILWALEDTHLVLTRFSRSSDRTISLYAIEDLDKPKFETITDTSPGILMPFYDEDTNVLVCTGKGDNSAFLFELLPEDPFLAELASFKTGSPHQAMSFLPKTICTVKDVEIMRCLRLTMTTIEPVSFTVPRVKVEYFQDDIFPETKVKSEPTMTSAEWFDGQNGQPQRTINLCPEGMKPLSQVPKAGPAAKKYSSREILEAKSDEQKKEEILSSMTNKLSFNEGPLPQDEMEGTEDDEWDD